MTPAKRRVHAADVRGFSRLAVEATAGLTTLVESMHRAIARAPGLRGAPASGATSGIAGLVYRSIRGVTGLVGGGIDALLAQVIPLIDERSPSPGREAVLAALNGVLGDHLAATLNPLAIPMRLRHLGRPLELEARALASAIPRPSGKLLVLVHGLCKNDLQWTRHEHDHGAALARDLGYTPVYLYYNSGLHVSTNGRAFSALMETLVAQWPVPLEDLVIAAHSMGGLVCRSAFHYGCQEGHNWPRRVRKLFFLGTPHHGAPLERGGNWVDVILGVSPYTAPLARLGKVRSAGITDLRYGSLLDEDWEGRDRFERAMDTRSPVPLPDGVECYVVAATTGRKQGDLRERLLGDGIVPLRSALGQHDDTRLALPIPAPRQWIGYAMNHLELLSRPEVYEQLRRWLGPARTPGEEFAL